MQKALKRASLCPEDRACDEQERSGTIVAGFGRDAKPPSKGQPEGGVVGAAFRRRVSRSLNPQRKSDKQGYRARRG